MTRKMTIGLAIAVSAMATAAHATDQTRKDSGQRGADLTVSITNLTGNTWLAPILVAAHPAGFSAFTEGQPASPELQAVAEIGDIEPLALSLPSRSAVLLNPAEGPLKPGGSATMQLVGGARPGGNTHLSVYAMLVPTNDGFIGLNAIEIPRTPGTYTYTVGAYDAGTEANDEAPAHGAGVNQPGMGLPPFLNDAAGKPAGIDLNAGGFTQAVKEGYVHVHRGIVGGAKGGPSALDHSMYRWLNPVARITLTVK